MCASGTRPSPTVAERRTLVRVQSSAPSPEDPFWGPFSCLSRWEVRVLYTMFPLKGAADLVTRFGMGSRDTLTRKTLLYPTHQSIVWELYALEKAYPLLNLCGQQGVLFVLGVRPDWDIIVEESRNLHLFYLSK